jgi:Holliday junction DNA helicase RuvA
MIGYLQGKLLRRSPEKVLLDVNGVGYAVFVPLSTFYEIERAASDGPIGLFIHTHLREGALELFGFWSEREKLLFEKLIAVGGIGPKLARVILSGMAPDDLVSSLADGDVARLTRVPGIGKKTAERMVVELKDKVLDLAAELPARPAAAQDEDLVLALVNLGYRRKDAEMATAAARDDHPDAAFHDLLRASLKRLSRA